jgi:DNA-binding transcriptional ArsR family regulator
MNVFKYVDASGGVVWQDRVMAARRKKPSSLTPEGFRAVAKRFRALSDPTRLSLLYHMAGGPSSVGDLVEATGVSQPTVSRQLGMLLDEGLVTRERQGNQVFYAVRDPNIFSLCEVVCGSVRDDADAQLRALSS